MVRVEHRSKAFGDRPLFADLSFALPASGFYSIMGPSGCGKTTLLRLLAGLEKPDKGTVERTGRLSFVFQEDRLLPVRTAFENVFDVCPDADRVHRLLAIAGLSEAEEKRPDELSGGMKRRVALVRALAFPHDLLLMDEPFTALDADVKADLIRLVREEERGKLVLIVTHDPSDAESLGCTALPVFSPSDTNLQ